ncbi:MAG: hypothetical protein M4579_006080 [Chaenotheca gracillima]|nr:MAG: hypothetical protein M4579_006080 [Chaenotheca gracillima]
MRTSDGSSSPPSASSPKSSGLEHPSPQLDLSSLPPTYVFPVRLPMTELHDLEEKLVQSGLALTYDVREAKLFLGKVGTKRRAELELRSRGLWTAQDEAHAAGIEVQTKVADDQGQSSKRRKLESTPPRKAGADVRDSSHSSIQVINLQWYEESLRAGALLPFEKYIVYEGQRVPRTPGTMTPQRSRTSEELADPARSGRPVRKSPILSKGAFGSILERAKADAAGSSNQQELTRFGRKSTTRREEAHRGSLASSSQVGGSSQTQPPRLVRQTTSEHDKEVNIELPEMPSWVKEKKIYSCERSTPGNSPNEAFINQLKEIKQARLLTGDEIGVRAYSTSIAALAAYPHSLTSTKEILALPGCDAKIARLFQEWKSCEGQIQTVLEIQRDKSMQVLRLFYDIWGVGAKTARDFYYANKWHDLDDIVEQGWNSLNRVQQIGVKFYDEFLEKIPRSEVDSIANVIIAHARRLTNDGTIEACIVGGYRRGKATSGDVDIVLSHRDESQTLGLVQEIVLSLEKEGWITHTLLLSLQGSHRNQQPLPYHGGGGDTAGVGFDTLDKALVVWQDTDWPTRAADVANAGQDGRVKNPNIHRRVDIIIAPWRTVGCAIAGWSGGTTFQRDLRRYAKNKKGWKFDSSGVRDRATGRVVDLEGEGGPAMTCDEAEKKVFAGLGLKYREPWERCTG